MSRLTEMEAFAAVVEEGGFTVAARRLGMSKSTVSKHISALEARLGARLLSRTTRRVNPTDIGLAYYDRASRILNDAGEADALVAELHAKPSGALLVEAPVDFGIHEIAPRLGPFLASNPDITVSLELTDTPKDMISDGVDLSLREGPLADSSLRARRICTRRLRLVASPEYLARNGYPDRPEDLSGHRLLGRSNRPGANIWTVASPKGETMSIQAHSSFCVNDGQSLLAAARAGFGIAQLPEYLSQPAISRGLLANAMPTCPDVAQDMFAVYPAGRFTQPKVRAFIDYLSEELEDPSRTPLPVNRSN